MTSNDIYKEPPQVRKRPFLKQWNVRLILALLVLFFLTDILGGRFGARLMVYVLFGTLLASSYLSYFGRQKRLTPWWQMVVVSPLATASAFLFKKPAGWALPALFIILGFLAVFAVYWDRRRGRRA